MPAMWLQVREGSGLAPSTGRVRCLANVPIGALTLAGVADSVGLTMASKTQTTRAAGTHRSLNAALDVAGTRCAMHVLLAASRGTRRFEGFVEETGISEAVIANRLRALVADGVLERRPYQEPGQRTRSEYALTDAGRGLVPVAEALARWGAELPPSPAPGATAPSPRATGTAAARPVTS
jgi:DNA-binding HxlR family transcriptional regulator